ncbi:MAG: hypothetical protein COW30_00715 [Rhodospirillales bacterium CG15_BIG_FIL_POST_REV_8_21_14_020_66_15]|nr:MAG: hypothetical protein COW30_00715 [Rhodospirillales bacterium CG15_BIG_FIL_POST_REV_8_21_14_020_66_15]
MKKMKQALHRLAYAGFSALAAVFFMPLLWLIRPLVSVKIVCIQGHRIGHLAHDFGSIVLLRQSEKGRHAYVVFTPPVANAYIRDVYAECMTIIEHARLFDFVLSSVPVMEAWGIYVEPPYTHNAYATFSGNEKVLGLPKNVESQGAELLESIGIPRDAWFVAFHSRDAQYFQQRFPNERLEYHDFRNSRVETYLKAAEQIARKGGFAFRMGTRSSPPLPADRHPRVIDYATEQSNALLDFYLCLKSRFILANSSGLYAVGTMAGVPVAAANMAPLFTMPITRNDLFIPKLLKRRKDGRILNFLEVANVGAGEFYRLEQYEKQGLQVVDNTEDEIADLCEEMFERIAGKEPPPDGKANQEAFRRFVQEHHPEIIEFGDISYRFLERHPYLLPWQTDTTEGARDTA